MIVRRPTSTVVAQENKNGGEASYERNEKDNRNEGRNRANYTIKRSGKRSKRRKDELFVRDKTAVSSCFSSLIIAHEQLTLHRYRREQARQSQKQLRRTLGGCMCVCQRLEANANERIKMMKIDKVNVRHAQTKKKRIFRNGTNKTSRKWIKLFGSV